jgi:hypothetical protein
MLPEINTAAPGFQQARHFLVATIPIKRGAGATLPVTNLPDCIEAGQERSRSEAVQACQRREGDSRVPKLQQGVARKTHAQLERWLDLRHIGFERMIGAG